MWHALFAAAVAGSTGFVAKRLLRTSDGDDLRDHRNSGEYDSRNDDKDAIFRFSSSESTSTRRKKKTRKEGRSGGSESEKRKFGARKHGVTLKRRKICRIIAGKSVSSSQGSISISSF